LIDSDMVLHINIPHAPVLVETRTRRHTEYGTNLIGTGVYAEDAWIKATLELWRCPYEID